MSQNTKIGVATLPLASVEALYCQPRVLEAAIKQATKLGLVAEGEVEADTIKSRIVEIANQHASQIAARLAERRIRQAVFTRLPTRREILDEAVTGELIVDLKEIIDAAQVEVRAAIELGYDRVLAVCPLKQTPAIGAVANILGYRNTASLIRGILNLIVEDANLRQEMRSLLPDPLPSPS